MIGAALAKALHADDLLVRVELDTGVLVRKPVHDTLGDGVVDGPGPWSVARQLVDTLTINDVRTIVEWAGDQNEAYWDHPSDGFLSWPGIVLVFAIVERGGYHGLSSAIEDSGLKAALLAAMMLRVRA